MVSIKEKIMGNIFPIGAGAAAGALAAAKPQTKSPEQQEVSKTKVAPTSPSIFILFAILIYLVDVLTKFNGLVLEAYQLTNINFIRGVVINGFTIIILVFYFFLRKPNRENFISFTVLVLTLSLIFSLGGINAGLLHLIFVIVLYFLYYKSSEDKATINYTFAILLWIDFFGYVFIPKIVNSYFPSIATDVLKTVANRLILPIWLYYVLFTKGQEVKIGRALLTILIIINLFYFASGIIFLQGVQKAMITPEQFVEARGFFAESFDNMKRFGRETIGYPLKCISSIGQPEDYQNCIENQRLISECKREKEPDETLEECLKRKLEIKKTTGAVDRTITDYVDVSLEKSTTKTDFTDQDDIEIIYKLKVQSPKVPVTFSNIKCEFTNQETKERFEGYARTTLPLNQETKLTAGGIFITCILLPEQRKPGRYESIATVEIQDVDTYATLPLYFMGNKDILYSKIGFGTYQEQFSNEMKLWSNEVNSVLVDGKVQSKAYPGLIWPRIGEPLDNNQITTLPIKGLQEGESINLIMSIINKATGKIKNIGDIILELPEDTALTQQGACSRFQLTGTNSYSITQLELGRIWLNNKIQTLAKQEKEAEVDLLSCDIQITNYPLFIDNPNTPSGPKYFTIKISDYDYEIQQKHSFTITKTKTVEEVSAS